jgi:hypothetical protein
VSDMQEQPLIKRLAYVFGKMQRHHSQSDDYAEDEPASSSTSEPGSDDDDNYIGEEDSTEDWDHLSFSHNSIGTHVDPKLATLLNGPQWQKSNPHTRRTNRVDYNPKKESSQTATKRRRRKSKVCMQCRFQRPVRTFATEEVVPAGLWARQNSGILQPLLTTVAYCSGRQ